MTYDYHVTRDRQRIGQWGEEIAAGYLQSNGYSILERNFRTRHGEIDIIASREGAIIFVEVKTRSNNRFAFPEQAVTPRKLESMTQAANVYLEENPEGSSTWQFDIIAITRSKDHDFDIEHFENVTG